jgi:hypothetical protein
MVRALLDGTKAQTRRVVKPQPTHFNPAGVPRRASAFYSPSDVIHCPYGQPGDQLWVRETWAFHLNAMASSSEAAGPWVYAADGDQALQWRLCERWRPSIHMPRRASRLTLNITEVRVQRLQDISEADARAEGVGFDPCEGGAFFVPGISGCASDSAVDSFRRLWQHINGSGSWDATLWVWAITFRKKCEEHS